VRNSASPPAAASIPTTSWNISGRAESFSTYCGGWQRRDGGRRRGRRLDRRGADPARLFADLGRQARRAVAGLSVDEHRRRRRLRHQRLVAPRHPLYRPQHRLDGDRIGRLMEDRAARRIVDLSHVITDGMVTYKGLPGPHICDFISREQSAANYDDGSTFQIGRIDMVANTGTYVDVPSHRFDDGKDLSEVDVDAFAHLPAVVVRQP